MARRRELSSAGLDITWMRGLRKAWIRELNPKPFINPQGSGFPEPSSERVSTQLLGSKEFSSWRKGMGSSLNQGSFQGSFYTVLNLGQKI